MVYFATVIHKTMFKLNSQVQFQTQMPTDLWTASSSVRDPSRLFPRSSSTVPSMSTSSSAFTEAAIDAKYQTLTSTPKSCLEHEWKGVPDDPIVSWYSSQFYVFRSFQSMKTLLCSLSKAVQFIMRFLRSNLTPDTLVNFASSPEIIKSLTCKFFTFLPQGQRDKDL